MFNNKHLPQSEADGVTAGFPDEEPRGASAPAPRFSRLALCVTAVGALALGVVGTIAYGVWFNHDQQAYAEAMTNASQSLGMSATVNGVPVRQLAPLQPETPAVLASTSAADDTARVSADGSDQGRPQEEGRNQAVWSGQIAQAPASTLPPASLAVAGSAAPASSAAPSSASGFHPVRRANRWSDPSSPQSAASRTVKDTRPSLQERRSAAANARQTARQNAEPRSNLFARIGLFFRRVSYRQHGGANPQQQDIYSHP